LGGMMRKSKIEDRKDEGRKRKERNEEETWKGEER
jgi:hypothetical protein